MMLEGYISLFAVAVSILALVATHRSSVRSKRAEQTLFKGLSGIIKINHKAHEHAGRQLSGLLAKEHIQTRIATKLAERAFNLASTANVGNAILAKTLQSRPRLKTKEQLLKNDLAQKKLDDLLGGDEYDFLRSVMSDEENDLLDQVKQHTTKHNGKEW